MQAVLARIDETHADLNAVVLAPRSRRVSRRRARRRARASRAARARPLEGVPLGVKELEDAARAAVDAKARCCSPIASPTSDSVQVAAPARPPARSSSARPTRPSSARRRSRRNRVYGVTRSPWNLELTPGGSSGGSSAAMAAGVLPLVTAGDGGGSIRIPASFTGCFGLKTSFGRVPREQLDHWEYGDDGGLRAAHEDGRGRGAGARPGGRRLARSIRPACRIPASRTCERVARAAAAQAAHRLLARPRLRGRAVRRRGGGRGRASRVFAKLGHRVERDRRRPAEAGRAWGLLGAFLLAAQLDDAARRARAPASAAASWPASSWRGAR